MINEARKLFAGVYLAQKRGTNGGVTTGYGAVNVRAKDEVAARKLLADEYVKTFPVSEGWDTNFVVIQVPDEWIDTAYAELHGIEGIHIIDVARRLQGEDEGRSAEW